MRQTKNYEPKCAETRQASSAGCEPLFKFENRRMRGPTPVQCSWHARARHTVCVGYTEARLCVYDVQVPPAPAAGLASRFRTAHSVNESPPIQPRFGATWFQPEPIVHTAISPMCCSSIRSSILPTSIFSDARIAVLCGTLPKAKTDQRVARA